MNQEPTQPKTPYDAELKTLESEKRGPGHAWATDAHKHLSDRQTGYLRALSDMDAPVRALVDAVRDTRPTLRWFVEQMEGKLRLNDHKGGWERMSHEGLVVRLLEEIAEMDAVVASGDLEALIQEAADVANFAFFIADCAWRHHQSSTNFNFGEGRRHPISRTEAVGAALVPVGSLFHEAKRG